MAMYKEKKEKFMPAKGLRAFSKGCVRKNKKNYVGSENNPHQSRKRGDIGAKTV